jgi:signal transduction histidine kinase/CheY-like chemotaxis protein
VLFFCPTQVGLLESKKSYVQYISHELRTPLNTAFLGLKLLTRDLNPNSSAEGLALYETLCDINISCKAAVDILNDLLCYEKLESGLLKLNKEEIPLQPLLMSSVSIFAGQTKESGVTMNLLLKTGEHIVPASGSALPLPLLPSDILICDKFKMDQVIRNLVSNALKFTPRGGTVTVSAVFVPLRLAPSLSHSQGPRLSLRMLSRKSTRYSRKVASFIGCEESQAGTVWGTLVMTVSDTGAGISSENQKRLFNEIIQFNPEKLQAGGGSGLGLWITRAIVDLHDGRISVSSEGEGKGSCFTVEMPMMRNIISTPTPASCHIASARQQSTRSPRARVMGGEHIASFPGRNETIAYDSGQSLSAYDILVVDDSRLNRKMLLRCLRADGHVCSEAADGLEAVMAVREKIDYANGGQGRPFDVILMDFVMPNMDGPTATKEIRAMGYTAPIFGLTGKGTQGMMCSDIIVGISLLLCPALLSPSHHD